jgi:uncharacterized membrane protein YhaH (DUF805 family)
MAILLKTDANMVSTVIPMGFGAAVRSVFARYGTFAGRARRAEFWWFVVFVCMVSIGTEILDTAIFGPVIWRDAAGTSITTYSGPISSLWGLAVLAPYISVAVRRLHDLGRLGWWWWLWLVPVIGSIVLLIWFARRGTVGPNRFGADPLTRPPPT